VLGDAGGHPVPGARAGVRTVRASSSICFEQLQQQGYAACAVDGVVHPLADPPKLKKQEKHDIEVVVDRFRSTASAKQRLTDSVETALRLADGIVVLDFVDREESTRS
jgi:excinuclease ABC subunit A